MPQPVSSGGEGGKHPNTNAAVVNPAYADDVFVCLLFGCAFNAAGHVATGLGNEAGRNPPLATKNLLEVTEGLRRPS